MDSDIYKVIQKVIVPIALVILFVTYFSFRWSTEAQAFGKARPTADTSAYVRISGEPLLTSKFWANKRPFVYPLVLRLTKAEFVRTAIFQTSFSVFAWSILALSISYSLSTILRPVAFGLILAVSLDRHIAGWDLVILTESLSLSLMALLLGTWLWLLRSWSWGKTVLLGIIAFLWAFTRDTNAWVLLASSGLIIFGVLFYNAKKQYFVLAAAFIAFFALSNLTVSLGLRWVYPFQNVLAQRILTDEQALGYFSNCGMPITPELLELAGGYANGNDRAFYLEPALGPYRIWLFKNGRSCYMRWLLSSSLPSLLQPLKGFESLVAFEEVDRFYPQSYRPLLPEYLERMLYPQNANLILWVLLTLAALAAIWRKAWKANPAWIVFIGLCLLIYPHLFIVWHGDTSGTMRHALSVSVQFVLSIWLLCLLLLESIYLHFSREVLNNRII